MAEPRPRVVVVGGGLAGLTVAYRLASASGGPAPDVMLFEAGERAGGAVRSLDLDGIEVEAGPDSFVVRKPWALELCGELGLRDRIVHPASSGALVWARGGLVAYPSGSAFGVPPGVESLVRWKGLPLGARLRGATDVWRPARPPAGDVSIGAFVTRRLGRECSRVLVGPLLAGINSGDPDRLSLRATFPELLGWEETYGSLIRGSRAAGRAAGSARTPGGERRQLFATLRGGLGTLVDALAGAVGRDRIEPNASVAHVEVAEGPNGPIGVHVNAPGPGPARVERADAVVFTTPAWVSASLMRAANPALAEELGAIAYGSSAVVALAYPPGTAGRLPDATGFIVPAGSVAGGRRLTVTACTWLSRKWPDPRFGDRAVVRAFVGRAGDEAALDHSDPEMVAAVVHDLDAIHPLGAAPEAAAIERWPRSMPQYEVGHLERLARIDRALEASPGVFLTGSAYRGVGIADVVHQANETAERVLAFLRTGSAQRTAAAAAPPPAAAGTTTTMEAS